MGVQALTEGSLAVEAFHFAAVGCCVSAAGIGSAGKEAESQRQTIVAGHYETDEVRLEIVVGDRC